MEYFINISHETILSFTFLSTNDMNYFYNFALSISMLQNSSSLSISSRDFPCKMVFQKIHFLWGFPGKRLLLKRMLWNQEFHVVKLESSIRTFYKGHHELADFCGIPVSAPLVSSHVLTFRYNFPKKFVIFVILPSLPIFYIATK